MSVDQPMPGNVEAEQAMLGAIFINNEAFHRVDGFLKPDHFAEEIHREIYKVCADLIGKGRLASPVTVKSFLPDDLTPDMTMSQYLARLAAEATTVLNAMDYGRIIYDQFLNRGLLEISTQIKVDACEPNSEKTPADIIEEAERALFAMAESGNNGRSVHEFGESLQEALDMAGAAYQRGGKISGVSTGISDLDRLTGGLQDSDLVILAARPGMGKTSLATNIAFDVASNFKAEALPDGTLKKTHGGRVLFFSLEMSHSQLATRIIAEQSGVPSSDMRQGQFSETQFDKMANVTKRLMDIPLKIDDQGGQNIGRIVSTSRRVKRQKGIDLIVIDYIQLLSGTTKRSGENRVQEITEITTKLKGLAKELNVPILALSQLSRQVENRDDKRPKLADLRDSGSIEQDADVVLFLYREEYYLLNSEPKPGTEKHLQWTGELGEAHGKAEVIVSKQRQGATGIINVHFDARLTKFSNLAYNQYTAQGRS